MIIPSGRRQPVALAAAIAVAAFVGGAIAAWHYHRLGLTLMHYDARGHLVVARRIFDSITPGWQQIGAVWLPLPHLLNAVPVQIDRLYRSGASAVAISVVSFFEYVRGRPSDHPPPRSGRPGYHPCLFTGPIEGTEGYPCLTLQPNPSC